MILVAEEVSVRLGRQQVVQPASLRLEPGETLGLIGPNGAGKTSLMRALAGLIPAEGRLLLGGQPLSAMTPRQRAAKLAYLAQGGQCHWAVSVEDLVALGLRAVRSPFAGAPPETGEMVARVLADLGVSGLAKRSVVSLSGGERASVLLARALVAGPSLLLADEPVAALDPGQQLRVLDRLRHRVDHGLGLLVILHDLSLAARYCDRLALMHRGRILLQGSTASVLASRELQESYGVSFAIGSVGDVPSVVALQP
ncbi:MAG: ABC transporter ATP-binding protein [Pseudomonadota bacterium]